MKSRRPSPSAAALLLAILLGVTVPVAPVSADTIYMPTQWNGRKVYLSPSSQTANVGCDGYNESTGARVIASRAKDYLYGRGYAVRIGSGTSSQNIASSNAWGSNIHVPVHSNAGTSDCTAPFNATNGGTWTMYEPGNTASSNLAQRILDAMRGYSPGTTDLKGTDVELSGMTLGELRQTNITSGYVEAAFHTYRPDVDWLRNASSVGGRIGVGIDNYFGNPRCPPLCPQRVESLIPAEAPAPAAAYEPVHPVASAPLRQRLEATLAGQGGWPFSSATADALLDASIDDRGVATINLRSSFVAVPNVSTSAGTAAMLTAFKDAVFVDPSVTSINFLVDGSCVQFWEPLGGSCQLIGR